MSNIPINAATYTSFFLSSSNNTSPPFSPSSPSSSSSEFNAYPSLGFSPCLIDSRKSSYAWISWWYLLYKETFTNSPSSPSSNDNGYSPSAFSPSKLAIENIGIAFVSGGDIPLFQSIPLLTTGTLGTKGTLVL